MATTMDVFALRDAVIGGYQAFIQEGFLHIRDDRIRAAVQVSLDDGVLWPEPWLSLNPKLTVGGTIDALAEDGLLHPGRKAAFRLGKGPGSSGTPLTLFRHQVEAIDAARAGENYVLTTGTGSGKSLSYIVPIVDLVLREPARKGIKAIVVYPMNALANSQEEELGKFLTAGYPDGRGPGRQRRCLDRRALGRRDHGGARPALRHRGPGCLGCHDRRRARRRTHLRRRRRRPRGRVL